MVPSPTCILLHLLNVNGFAKKLIHWTAVGRKGSEGRHKPKQIKSPVIRTGKGSNCFKPRRMLPKPR